MIDPALAFGAFTHTNVQISVERFRYYKGERSQIGRVVEPAEKFELAGAGLLGVPTTVLVKYTFIFASSTLFVDLLQLLFGFWSIHIGVVRWNKRDIAGEDVEFFYDEANLGKFGMFLYEANEILLPFKFLLALLAGASFVFLAFAISLA